MGDDDREGIEERQIARRDMLRRGAIVAGTAWTAPLIIESITSPVYAVGTPNNTTCSAVWVRAGNTGAFQNPDPGPATCNPTGYGTLCAGTFPTTTISGIGLTATTSGAGATMTVTFTIAAAKPCTIVRYRVNNGATCSAEVAVGAKTTGAVTPGSGTPQVRLVITCLGT